MRELAVFAKYWQAGQVKTRLATAIGAEAASHLYRGFLQLTLSRHVGLADRQALVFSPSEAKRAFQMCAGKGWQCVAQSSGDLGQRLDVFFGGAFRRHATRVLVIGSDSPTLPRAYLQQAFRQLEQADAVLGPTPDGGYYAIGLKQYQPDLFSEIAWSSRHVWSQTLQRLQDLRLSWRELPCWYDVDHADDLYRLVEDLNDQPARSQIEDRLLNDVREVIRRSRSG